MNETGNQPNDQPQNEPSPGTPSAQPPAPADAPPSQDDKNLALLCHLLGFFTSFLGPLILWLLKKDESPFVSDQAKEALNFQITVIIGWAIAGVTAAFCIGAFIGMGVGVVDLVFCILATVEASKGKRYRYPICLRLIT